MTEDDQPSAPDIKALDAAAALLRLLEPRYPVKRVILFGSRARGRHGVDSDADLVVVLDGPRGDRAKAAVDMAGLAFDVLMETGVLVDALPLWEDEFERRVPFSNPALLDNIRRDGIVVSPRP